MKTLKKCAICGKEDFKQLYTINDKAMNLKEKFNLNSCKNCKLIFINPQPTFEELKKHYPKKYYSLEKIKTKEKSRKVRFRIFLYDLYFNPKNKNYFLKIIFSPIKNYLRGTVIKPSSKFLDVGSGSGQFLYEMQNFKMNSFGCEPSQYNKKSTKENGLKIKNDDLINSRYKKDTFDIITMNHVLEHVPNPLETIKELHKILKKEGTLIVAVPNHDSFAHKIFKENWYQLDVPRHLFDFSSDLLIETFEKAGFKIKKVVYNSRSSQFTFSLRFLFKIRFPSQIIMILDILFFPLTILSNILKKGDQIEIWATK